MSENMKCPHCEEKLEVNNQIICPHCKNLLDHNSLINDKNTVWTDFLDKAFFIDRASNPYDMAETSIRRSVQIMYLLTVFGFVSGIFHYFYGNEKSMAFAILIVVFIKLFFTVAFHRLKMPLMLALLGAMSYLGYINMGDVSHTVNSRILYIYYFIVMAHVIIIVQSLRSYFYLDKPDTTLLHYLVTLLFLILSTFFIYLYWNG